MKKLTGKDKAYLYMLRSSITTLLAMCSRQNSPAEVLLFKGALLRRSYQHSSVQNYFHKNLGVNDVVDVLVDDKDSSRPKLINPPRTSFQRMAIFQSGK